MRKKLLLGLALCALALGLAGSASAVAPKGSWCYSFNQDMIRGQNSSIGPDAVALIAVLEKEGLYFSNGSQFYGEKVQRAVRGFQMRYKITPISGNVGGKTRAKLNALYGCPTDSCGKYFWFDYGTDSTIACKYAKNLCGNYQYDGLQVFKSQKDCKAAFKKVVPSITVISPEEGDQWVQDELYKVKWTSKYVNLNEPITVIQRDERGDFVRDERPQSSTGAGEAFVHPYGASVTEKNTFMLEVVAAAGFQNFIRGRSGIFTMNFGHFCDSGQTASCITNNGSGTKTCNANNRCGECVVTTPYITITSPNTGETWRVGETRNITWNSHNLAENDYVSIGINGYEAESSLVKEQIARVIASNGSYTWTIPSTMGGESLAGKNYHVYVTGDNDVGYASSDYFKIVAQQAFSNYSESALASIAEALKRITEQLMALKAGQQ